MIYYWLTLCSFQPRGERVRYLLIKWLGESQRQTEREGENTPDPVGSTTTTSQFPVQRILVKSTRLSRTPKLICVQEHRFVNPLTPNDPYSCRTAPLTSEIAFYISIQQIQVLNILNTVYTLRFFLFQNAVCFIILTYLVPVLFTFYIFIQQI